MRVLCLLALAGFALGDEAAAVGDGKNGINDVPTYTADHMGNTDARAHMDPNAPTRAPTADHDDTLAGVQKKDHKLNFDKTTLMDQKLDKMAAKIMEHVPTNSPTKFPTKDATGCYWGDGVTWPVGYKGAGFGENYCNLWECMPKAVWRKQAKDCSMRTKAKKGEEACSHTTCGFSDSCFIPDGDKGECTGYKFMDASGKKRKVVQVRTHHAEEKGGKHRCNWNLHHRSCTCLCHGDRRQDLPGFHWGSERPLRTNELYAEGSHPNTMANKEQTKHLLKN